MRRILVVEDEAPVRELVARHLEKKGYSVTQASDAEEVLLQMSRDREPFDLVLSDIHLPGLNGVELLRLLLTHSPLRPVIMITGDSDETLARKALNYGATGYLLKPFELFELDAAVQQAISRLELVEAAEMLARADAESLPDQGMGGGVLPAAWLELADSRSDAGPGHGYRVARIAGALASAMEEPLAAADRAALDTAARAHELGRLLGPSPAAQELSARTAQLLYDLGVDSPVLRIVNNFREYWDGSGGPNGISGGDIPLGSRLLSAADAVDHAATARLNKGVDPGDAISEAVAEVGGSAEAHHGPAVARSLETATGVIEAIWVLARGPGKADAAGVSL